jgi:hypothetical protein
LALKGGGEEKKAAARRSVPIFREPPESKKIFHGFKAKLVYERAGNKQENTDPMHLETDIRFSNSDLNDELPEIIMRDKQGREVVRVPDTKYHYVYAVKGTEPGNTANLPLEIVPENEILHYQVVNGKEIPVGKFERTKEIVVNRFMPKIEMDMWQLDNTYEIWADHTHGLYEVARDLEQSDEIGISKVSFGGFKESYALISSVREGDRFVITMSLTRQRKRFYHAMPFTEGADDFKEESNKVQGLLEEM